MEGFFTNSYDVLLVVWGCAWIVVGVILMYLVYRVISSEDTQEAASATSAPPEPVQSSSETKTLVSAGR